MFIIHRSVWVSLKKAFSKFFKLNMKFSQVFSVVRKTNKPFLFLLGFELCAHCYKSTIHKLTEFHFPKWYFPKKLENHLRTPIKLKHSPNLGFKSFCFFLGEERVWGVTLLFWAILFNSIKLILNSNFIFSWIFSRNFK